MKKSGDPKIGKQASICHAVANKEAAYNCHPERARVEQGEASVSRRTPAVPFAAHPASGNSDDTLSGIRWRLQKAWNTLRATLSEIFDESAYDRFLFRTHQLRSVASYRDFMRERDVAMAKKPRCC